MLASLEPRQTDRQTDRQTNWTRQTVIDRLTEGMEMFLDEESDVDARELVGVWLVSVAVQEPVVSRAFQITLPVSSAAEATQKVSH